MTSFEKAEIRRLPKKYRPMGAFSYFFRTIIYLIPVLGWIICLVAACNGKKIARRSHARAMLFLDLIIIAAAILGITGVVDYAAIIESVKALLPF